MPRDDLLPEVLKKNAQRNLHADDLDGACDKLGAFINQVGAQSGKKIDADDADDLIAEAERGGRVDRLRLGLSRPRDACELLDSSMPRAWADAE